MCVYRVFVAVRRLTIDDLLSVSINLEVLSELLYAVFFSYF